jgi:hypothetical protein
MTYCDDIKLRRVIVTVREMVTVVEMVARVNPCVDQRFEPVILKIENLTTEPIAARLRN